MMISENDMPDLPIAIGARLVNSHYVRTLGFKPNFSDYSQEEQSLIRSAPKIYYPTLFYSDLFNTMGKETFPSFYTYAYALDKIRQTTVFQMLNIPHPNTRFFYGNKQKKNILNFFQYPFIGKKGKGSSKGAHIYLIDTAEKLNRYLFHIGDRPSYIQEYMPIEKDIRVVIIGKKVRLAYWRVAAKGQFKTNLSQGGKISFDTVPPKALELALFTARQCRWDDIGIDIIEHRGTYYVLEANVKYGTQGFKKAGIDYKNLLENLILAGEI